MASIFALSFQLTGTTPLPNAWAVVDTKLGLHEFSRITGKANLIGATGGTLDVVLQTGLQLPGSLTAVVGGWKDIWRSNQLASGAAAISWDVVLTRAATASTTTPTQVNPTDGTPTIAVNTVLPQSFQDSLRLIVLPGANTTVGALLTFDLVASP